MIFKSVIAGIAIATTSTVFAASGWSGCTINADVITIAQPLNVCSSEKSAAIIQRQFDLRDSVTFVPRDCYGTVPVGTQIHSDSVYNVSGVSVWKFTTKPDSKKYSYLPYNALLGALEECIKTE